jgi:nitroreductase
MNDDILRIIRERRSIRQFLNQQVSDEDIKKIIEAGNWAPSASNLQGWRFIVVDKPDIKERLVALGGSVVIKDAPTGILVVYDNRSLNLEYMDFVQSASAAIQNMLLVSCSLGIGSCWICRLPTKQSLRKIFNIPAHYDPVAYIAIGYPQGEHEVVVRKYRTNDLIAYNNFSFNANGSFNPVILFISRIKRRLYFLCKQIIYLWKK